MSIGKNLQAKYPSRTLNVSEHNYLVIGKELVAIAWATKYFGIFLVGRLFSIITHRKLLEWLISVKDPNSKWLRWPISSLEEYDYKIIYKKGEHNTYADAHSLVEIDTNETELFHVIKNRIRKFIPKPKANHRFEIR